MKPFKIIAIMVFLVSLAYLISCTDRKITSHDTQENFTVGSEWHSRAENNPPVEVINISLADGATGIGIDFELTWQVTDPNPNPGSESLRFEVYLGVDPDPPLSYFTRQERYISPWRIQNRCSDLLLQIHSAQQSYRQQYGAYCLDGATADYYNNPDGFALLGISLTEIDYYTYVMTATQNNYSCVAAANIDIDAINDIWQITENGNLVNTTNDLEDPFQYDTVFYWKIVARDSFGQEITGPIWSFTTAPQ